MADRAKKISELNAITANTVANNDLFVVVDTSGTETKSITANNLAHFIGTSIVLRGPYASDAAANTAGVPVGGVYYNSSGAVVVRIS
jgi:uncharacterized phosphosugar-binding protein